VGLIAVAEALKAQGFQVETLEMAEGAGAADIVRSLMAKPGRPTVLLASDPTVRGVLSACVAIGVSVPGDISVLSLNDITSDSHHRRHGISSITVDPHRMGRACGAAMLAWLAGSRPAARTLVQSATFHIRATTGAAP
jgi:DNA-binding LacI/PurR family transcriptional regulator